MKNHDNTSTSRAMVDENALNSSGQQLRHHHRRISRSPDHLHNGHCRRHSKDQSGHRHRYHSKDHHLHKSCEHGHHGRHSRSPGRRHGYHKPDHHNKQSGSHHKESHGRQSSILSSGYKHKMRSPERSRHHKDHSHYRDGSSEHHSHDSSHGHRRHHSRLSEHRQHKAHQQDASPEHHEKRSHGHRSHHVSFHHGHHKESSSELLSGHHSRSLYEQKSDGKDHRDHHFHNRHRRKDHHNKNLHYKDTASGSSVGSEKDQRHHKSRHALVKILPDGFQPVLLHPPTFQRFDRSGDKYRLQRTLSRWMPLGTTSWQSDISSIAKMMQAIPPVVV